MENKEINNGIFNKYIITRTDGKEINPENEYFVLKLSGDGDPKHMKASRKAIIKYAKKIKKHLPQLSKELLTKYKKKK